MPKAREFPPGTAVDIDGKVYIVVYAPCDNEAESSFALIDPTSGQMLYQRPDRTRFWFYDYGKYNNVYEAFPTIKVLGKAGVVRE